MPGSPPTRMAEAGTRPPPSTRSSSAIPIGARGGGSALPASPTKLIERPTGAFAAEPGRVATNSSSTVFHSPQVSQRPAHFGVTAPQDRQTKREAGLANAGPYARAGCLRGLPRPFHPAEAVCPAFATTAMRSNCVAAIAGGGPPPFPPMFSPPMFSTNAMAIAHALHLFRFHSRLGSYLHDADCIVEFGGGFGSMCRLIGALGFRGRYVIFDLPPVLALQRYYLGLHGIEADDSGRADVWLCPALDLVMDRLSKGKTGSGVADVNLGTERDGNDGAATSRAIFPPRRCQAGSVGLSAKLREE
jgi:hypothetical protein